MRLREIAERGPRFVEVIDAAHDHAPVTQEELNNRLAEHTNKAIYVLSIVAAIFLPRDIEEVLVKHPSVREVAVYGVSSEIKKSS